MAAWLGGILATFAVCFAPLLFVSDPNWKVWGFVAAYQITWCAAESAFALRYRGVGSSGKHDLFPGMHGLAAFLFTGFANFACAMGGPIDPGFLVTAVVCGVVGLILRCWSIATLKQHFRDTIDFTSNQTVITSGPYRFLKHPAELGFLFLLFGISLVAGKWALIFFGIVMVPFSIARMILENRLLRRFGKV